MKLSIIVAADEGGAIGQGGKIPWHLPADFKHFKDLTMGHPIVMGRKTFESIGKALPGRMNIVITSDPKYKAEGCVIVASMPDALRAAENSLAGDSNEIFVIGGERVYKAALSSAEIVYLTRVHGKFEGDAFFPDLDEAKWEMVRSEAHQKDEKNSLDYDFLTYAKK